MLGIDLLVSESYTQANSNRQRNSMHRLGESPILRLFRAYFLYTGKVKSSKKGVVGYE